MNGKAMLNYHTIKLTELVQELSSQSSQEVHLFDREIGQQLRQKIEQEISQINHRTVHYLDFKNICSIDFSCADELIGKLLSRLLANEYGAIFFVLQGLNNNHKENIQVVLERRKVGCLEKADKTWYFWGYRKASLWETLNVVMENGEVTARDLCRRLKLGLTTASTRLSQLHKAHLVHRDQVIIDGGGMEYVYRKLF